MTVSTTRRKATFKPAVYKLPDKGKMRQEREEKEALQERYADFMHRLHLCFSRWI